MFLTVGLASALVGCRALDQVASTLDGGRLTFLACQSFSASEINAYVRPVQSTDSLKLVWSIRGNGTFGPTTPIVYGIAPDGWDVKVEPVPLDVATTQIQLEMSGFNNGSNRLKSWNVSGDKLREAQWLDEGGKLETQPCT